MSARGDGHGYLEVEEYETWNALLRLSKLVLGALDDALRASDDLSVTDFDVLITLYNAPERRLGMTALAQAVLLSPSGLTHLVTRLERHGLVARAVNPSDARKFFTVLTDKGGERLRRARTTHNGVLRSQLLEFVTPAERRALARIWRRVETDGSAARSSGLVRT